jgi:hypothetical protein
LKYNIKKIVEYDISSLIDNEYIIKHNLDVNPMNGINKRVIEKFNIVNIMEPSGESSDIIDKIKKLNNITYFYNKTIGDRYLILEIGINEDKFAIRTLVDPYSKTVSKQNFQKFILSSTPHYYNQHMSDMIFDRAVDKSHRNIINGFNSEKMINPPSERIKKSTIECSISKFDAYLDNISLSSYTDNKTKNSAIKSIYDDKDCIDITVECLSESLLFHIIGNDIKIYDNVEIYISFMSMASNVINNYKREYVSFVNDLFTSDKVLKSKLLESTWKKYLIDWYIDIITKALNSVDSPPNSFSELEFNIKEYYLRKKSRF